MTSVEYFALKRASSVFFLVILGLNTSIVLAQSDTPVPSITSATLSQYRGEYQQSPLCSKDEITLWSCEANKHVFSLCSSQVASRTTGYLQYRAASAGNMEFTYPAVKTPPLGLFKYNSFVNGDASIEFTNGEYHYSLIDPLRERSYILVLKPGSSTKNTEIACGPNRTLQVNYTMRLMYDFGLWTRDSAGH